MSFIKRAITRRKVYQRRSKKKKNSNKNKKTNIRTWKKAHLDFYVKTKCTLYTFRCGNISRSSLARCGRFSRIICVRLKRNIILHARDAQSRCWQLIYTVYALSKCNKTTLAANLRPKIPFESCLCAVERAKTTKFTASSK